MKRLILSTLIIGGLLGSTSLKAQKSSQPTTPVKVGSTTLSLGIGAGVQYDGHYYRNPFGTKVVAEWGLWHAGPGAITLGGEVGGSFSSKGDYHENHDYKASTIVVAVRSAWHYGWNVKGLDTYAGLSAGLGFEHYGNDDHNDNDVIPVPGIFVGASYFFTPGFGVNAEAGSDITNFQLGVIFKLQ